MAHHDWTGADLTGRLAGGRYRVTAHLSEGGMATIYRARGSDGAEVVVKTPLPFVLSNPQFRARFEREVKALAALRHPHVVRLADAGEWNGLPFLVVPLYGGGTLASRQTRTAAGQAAMPVGSVGGWLGPVAAAVDFLHQRKLWHRDIKPENIFFDAAGQPLVADFGIVKVAADDPDREATVYTEPGSTLGTPAYMAPELIMGRAVDGRIDVYALGVMVYEWLTGRLPFDATNPAAILVKQFSAAKTLTHPSDLIPGLPREAGAAVLRAMAINPADRFPRATDFAAAFLAAVRPVLPADPSSVSRPAPLPPPPPPEPLPPLTPAPVRQPAEPLRQLLGLPTDWPTLSVLVAHLLLAWVVLLGGLARVNPTDGETPVGGATVVFATPPVSPPTPPAFDLWDGLVALTLWPTAFVVAAVLVWFRSPPARVVGLLVGAVVGGAALTQLLAGFFIARPLLLGGWLAPWWVGLPYAVGVWVASFLPRFAHLFHPAPPPAVTVLARCSVLLGCGLAVAAVTALVRLAATLPALGWVLLVLLAMVGVALVPAGVGLARRREWARLTVLALSGALGVSVVGLAFFAAAALVLLRRHTAAEFRTPSGR
jgi:serine/threonine protein kinase